MLFFGIIHLYPNDPAGFGGALIAVYVAFALCILGLLLSIGALLRREPARWLYRLGFAINLVPCLIALSFVARAIAR